MCPEEVMLNSYQLYGVDVIAGLLAVELVVGRLTDLLELDGIL